MIILEGLGSMSSKAIRSLRPLEKSEEKNVVCPNVKRHSFQEGVDLTSLALEG